LFKASFRNGYKIFLIEQAGLRVPSVGVDHRLGVVLEASMRVLLKTVESRIK
jgi:hypothetical protein